MPESPLVPDDFAPGTQVPLRPERPLTRREIRDREAAALRHDAGAAEDSRGVVPVPQSAAWSAAAPQAFASGVARPVETPRTERRDLFGAAQPRAERPGFDELFGAAPAASHPTHAGSGPTPASSHPTHAGSRPTPASSHPVSTSDAPDATAAPAPRRRAAQQTQSPFSTPEAEQADRPTGRSSASAVSSPASPRREPDGGFDALFAGIGDDDDDDELASSGASSRSQRPSRADRKAAKAAKGAKSKKASKFGKTAPAGPRRTGGIPVAPVATAADLAALVGGTGASAATTSVTAQAAAGSNAGFASALSAAAAVPAPSTVVPTAPASLPADPRRSATDASPAPASESTRPAAAPATAATPATPLTFDRRARRMADDSFDLSTDVAADLFGLTAEPSIASPPPRAIPAERPRDDRRRPHSARETARSAPRTAKVRVRVSGRPQSRPVASASPRGRGGRRFVASLVAMSFAALLAVATTIPSLSLLTPSDVQALALSSPDGPTLDGQRVVLNGDIVAQSVQREGYESQTIEEYARAAGIRPEATFTNNPSGTIQWPFAVGVHIGDRFGYRDCWGCSSNHGGQDFNPGLGAEIQAIADGVVSNSTDSGGSLGVVMMIDHVINGELITSVYAHMEYDSRRFEVGDTVQVGDPIGTTGDTGMSTGPHLHFEIRIGGINGTKVDPLEWLYANTN